MREPGGLARLAGIGIALLMVAGGASASPSSGHLIVQGPLEATGPAEVAAEGATILLQDPGNADYRGVLVQLQAADALVTHIRIQQTCVESLPVNLGGIAPLPSLPSLTRIDPFADARNALRDAALATNLGGRLDGTLGALAPLDSVVVLGTDDVAQALAPQRSSASSSGEGSNLPLGFSCVRWAPMEQDEPVQLRNAQFIIRGEDPAYTFVWRAARDKDDTAAGRGTLRADAIRTQFQLHDEAISLVPRTDDHHDALWDDAPRAWAPGNSIGSTAGSGSGDIQGAGTALLYQASADVLGVQKDGTNFQKRYSTGEQRTSGAPGLPGQRVLDFLRIEFKGTQGQYDSSGTVRIVGETQRASLDGDLLMEGARGSLAVGNETFALKGQPLKLGGQFAYTLQPLSAEELAAEAQSVPRGPRSAPGMKFAIDGDVRHVESAGIREEFPPIVTTTAAAVSAFAMVAGLLAYFWPALKFAATPLYTRIAPDAVLMHGAREQIYRLIKDEPGIHAHEVAQRLDLGWGTAVYHLKLLERSGLLVSKHEGRYKRFFVTGDPRILRKEAVALLRNSTARSIAGAVARKPGMIQKQVCQTLGLSPSLASWHLQRLEQAQLVQAQRLGRSVSYMPGPAWAELEPVPAVLPAIASAPAAAAQVMPALPAMPAAPVGPAGPGLPSVGSTSA